MKFEIPKKEEEVVNMKTLKRPKLEINDKTSSLNIESLKALPVK
jgi:hypothetical protein